MKNTTRVYYDCEFIEGSQTERMFGIELRTLNNAYAYLFAGIAISFTFMSVLNLVNGFSISNTNLFGMVFFWYIFAYYAWNGKPERWVNKPTIDLISIGMVRDDGQELYLISKDFNLREAWERYQTETMYNHGDMRNQFGDTWEKKVYWIRENVLMPIYWELCCKESSSFTEEVYGNYENFIGDIKRANNTRHVYKNLKRLINKYGLTSAEIANKIEEFVFMEAVVKGKATATGDLVNVLGTEIIPTSNIKLELYGWYSAYDHVVMCWLFGLMNDLPKGFPYYTIDLEQMLLEKATDRSANCFETVNTQSRPPEYWMKRFKERMDYPKQTNEHNALADARFNRDLHNFILSL